jgi:hypothetical protein
VNADVQKLSMSIFRQLMGDRVTLVKKGWATISQPSGYCSSRVDHDGRSERSD